MELSKAELQQFVELLIPAMEAAGFQRTDPAAGASMPKPRLERLEEIRPGTCPTCKPGKVDYSKPRRSSNAKPLPDMDQLNARLNKLERKYENLSASQQRPSAMKFVKGARANGHRVSIVDELSRRIAYQRRMKAAKTPSERAGVEAREAVERARAEGRKLVFKTEYEKALARIQP